MVKVVDHHRHAVARVIDKQPLARHMRLSHRHRQATFPFPVKVAESRVPISAGMGGDIFVPQNRQRHVLASKRAMKVGPVRLRPASVARLDADTGEQAFLKRRIRQAIVQTPS